MVKDILVKEGSMVEEGQVLVRLDDTLTRATLGVVRSQLDENHVRQARLLAERKGVDVMTFPAELAVRREEITVALSFNGEEKFSIPKSCS